MPGLYQRDGIWGATARGGEEPRMSPNNSNKKKKKDSCSQLEWILPCNFSCWSHSARFTYLLTSSAFILHENKQEDRQCAHSVHPPLVSSHTVRDRWFGFYPEIKLVLTGGELRMTNLMHHQMKMRKFPLPEKQQIWKENLWDAELHTGSHRESRI